LMQDNVSRSDTSDGQNQFDAATFLYDLYKTCTVREID